MLSLSPVDVRPGYAPLPSSREQSGPSLIAALWLPWYILTLCTSENQSWHDCKTHSGHSFPHPWPRRTRPLTQRRRAWPSSYDLQAPQALPAPCMCVPRSAQPVWTAQAHVPHMRAVYRPRQTQACCTPASSQYMRAKAPQALGAVLRAHARAHSQVPLLVWTYSRAHVPS